MTSGRKKSYLTLLVVGAAALGVDSLVLTEEMAKPASAIAGGPLGAAGALAGKEAVEDLSIPKLRFPRALPTDTGSTSIRDLFAPVIRTSTVPGDGAATDNSRLEVVASQHAAFRENHRLGGVLVQQRLRIAIVDGKWIRVGDKLDGCTLKTVAGNDAVFSCVDGEVVLQIVRSLPTRVDD